MRLFLSSENLGRYPAEFLELVGGSRKLATIHNAIDDWPESERSAKVKNHLEQLKNQGSKPKDIDLRDYFNKQKELAGEFAEFDGIFVFGGNTFILTRAFHYSGADKLLYDMVRKNEIAYGGSSAGSIIATPSLRGSELGDHPEVTPDGYKKEVFWDGLNFVSYYIVPHYKSNWFGVEAQAMANYFKHNYLPYRLLEDGQVILINDAKEEFLS